MSVFKFACPVCGQHITADSADSGGQIECPTCFRKIVVPQYSGSADPKFVITAAQVSKPKPVPAAAAVQAGTSVEEPSASNVWLALAGVALVALGAGGFWAFHSREKGHGSVGRPPETNQAVQQEPVKSEPSPKPAYAIPTSFQWSLSLSNAAYPEAPASGGIRNAGFQCERATLQGGQLALRQGKSGGQEVSVTIYLFAEQSEDLAGKTIDIKADRKPPLPKVALRWKNSGQQSGKEEFNSGYALKLSFGAISNHHLPGRLFLCLPDDDKSFLAGAFDAEIKRPSGKPK
jgi:hypothetical protein